MSRCSRLAEARSAVVFNVLAPATLDAEIMALIYRRIDQVVRDMSTVGEEFNEGLAEDIRGELADLLDGGRILEEATDAGIVRTCERIDEALQRARESLAKQRELFDYVTSFDPDEMRGDLVIGRTRMRVTFD